MSSSILKARRSALQISSFSALRYTSGDLHNGQTRISSSFASMGGYLSQYVFDQGRVDLGIHMQRPISLIGERGAFYRIFFGEEYCVATRKGQVVCGVRMMVGESVRCEGDAQCLQVPEITRREAYAGHGMIAQRMKMAGGNSFAGIEQVMESFSRQAHRVLACRRWAGV